MLQILFLTSLYELESPGVRNTIKHCSSQRRPAGCLGETDGQSKDLRVLFLFLHFPKGFSRCDGRLNLGEFVWCRATKLCPLPAFPTHPNLRSTDPTENQHLLLLFEERLFEGYWRMQAEKQTLYTSLTLLCLVLACNLWIFHSKTKVFYMEKNIFPACHYQKLVEFYRFKWF